MDGDILRILRQNSGKIQNSISEDDLADSPVRSVIESQEKVDITEEEPVALDLIQEYRDLYKQLQQIPPEDLAPHGTVHWYVPDSDIEAGPVSTRE